MRQRNPEGIRHLDSHELRRAVTLTRLTALLCPALAVIIVVAQWPDVDPAPVAVLLLAIPFCTAIPYTTVAPLSRLAELADHGPP